MSVPSLTVPDPALVLLVGIAGCGKSTFAARHFAETEVLSSDRFRELVCDDPDDQSASGDAFAVLRFVLDKRLKRRRLSVVDATNLERRPRSEYLSLAGKYDVPAVAIVLDVEFDVCRERDAGRPGRTVGEEVLRRQRRELSRALRRIDDEPYAAVHVLGSAADVAAAEVVRARTRTRAAP